jgi:GNAT superfamily N-acetyltransferase
VQVTGVRQVAIRRAGPQDALALMTLRAAWRGTAVSEDFASQFVPWFEREGSQRWWWLAEDPTGTGVGMVNLKLFERMPIPDRSAGRWGYLANLFVQPAYRNEGVGSRLLAALLANSQDEGLVRVVLSPTEQSVPLYRRAGFLPADMLLVWQPPPEAEDV